ncbi:MAG TPA: DNA polymerase III subunit beta [Polyangiaceae bacterium]|nr:DNA polymerase III subunit beta [Polyangiaceae bacterium]
MHAVVTKRDLGRILARCQGVADKKSTMPVLGNVLLEALKSGDLGLAATDLYLGVSGSISAKIEKPGSVAVGARDLFERVKMMPEGNITIAQQNDGSVTIRAQGQARRYTLKGLPGSEFPTLPQPGEGASSMTLGTEVLSELIAKTHFSIAADDTRPHLNSALFQMEGHNVRMVTTDGHRLSKMEIEQPEHEATASMLIPLKGIQELKRLCDEAKSDGTGHISVLQSGTNAFFRVPGLQLGIKLVEVQFPPYGQVIPKETRHHVTAPRALVADALKAVSLAANDRTGGVKVTLGSNMMRFSSESAESGDGFDEVPVDYAGSELTVGFNAHYLLQVLSSIDQEDVVLGVSGELDPATVRPGTAVGRSDYLAVIMPMRI